MKPPSDCNSVVNGIFRHNLHVVSHDPAKSVARYFHVVDIAALIPVLCVVGNKNGMHSVRMEIYNSDVTVDGVKK